MKNEEREELRQALAALKEEQAKIEAQLVASDEEAFLGEDPAEPESAASIEAARSTKTVTEIGGDEEDQARTLSAEASHEPLEDVRRFQSEPEVEVEPATKTEPEVNQETEPGEPQRFQLAQTAKKTEEKMEAKPSPVHSARFKPMTAARPATSALEGAKPATGKRLISQQRALPLLFGLMVLIGIIWIFNVANQAGYLSEFGKVTLFYFGSLLLFLATHRWVRSSFLRQTLLAVALGAALVTTFTGTVLYHLMPLALGFTVAVLLTLFGCWVSLQEQSQVLAGMMAVVSFLVSGLLLRPGLPVFVVLGYLVLALALLSWFNRRYRFEWAELATVCGANLTLLSLTSQGLLNQLSQTFLLPLLMGIMVSQVVVGIGEKENARLLYAIGCGTTVLVSGFYLISLEMSVPNFVALVIGGSLAFWLGGRVDAFVRDFLGSGLTVLLVVGSLKVAQAEAWAANLTWSLLFLILLGVAVGAFWRGSAVVLFVAQGLYVLLGVGALGASGVIHGEVLLLGLFSGWLLFQNKMKQNKLVKLWRPVYFTLGYLLALLYFYQQSSHILLVELAILVSLWAIQGFLKQRLANWFFYVDAGLKVVLVLVFAFWTSQVSSTQEILQFYYIFLLYLLGHGVYLVATFKQRGFALELVTAGLVYLSLFKATNDSFMPFLYMVCGTACWLAYVFFSDSAQTAHPRLVTSWVMGLLFGYLLAFRQVATGFSWTVLLLTLILLGFAKKQTWQRALNASVLRIALTTFLGIQLASFVLFWAFIPQSLLGAVIAFASLLLYSWLAILGQASQVFGNWWRRPFWLVVAILVAVAVARVAGIAGAVGAVQSVLFSAVCFLFGGLFLWMATEKHWKRFDYFGLAFIGLSLAKMLLFDLGNVALLFRGMLFLILGIFGLLLLFWLQKRAEHK